MRRGYRSRPPPGWPADGDAAVIRRAACSTKCGIPHFVEILQHWYAGRSKKEVAASLGVDRATVAKYVAPALAAGLVPGGPVVGEEQWRAWVREWFPSLVDTRLRQPSWGQIEVHRERIETLVGVVPMSVIHQRLRDEHGLEASVASFRRYMRAHFPTEVRQGEVIIWRPPIDAGAEAQVDYGYMGAWVDPSSGKRRRVWAFSMVLSYSRHLFVYPTLRMDQQAWIDAHVAAAEFFGGLPARIVLDNLRAGVVKADIYDPKINRAYAELAAHYQLLLDPARVAHPKDKPRIEAVQKYIRSSFFAGRDFASMTDMVAQARRWSAEVAGRRTPRSWRGAHPSRSSPPKRPAFSDRCRWCPSSMPDGPLLKWRPTLTPRWAPVCTPCPTSGSGFASTPGRRSSGSSSSTTAAWSRPTPSKPGGGAPDWADLPENKVGFFMRNPVWCRTQASMIGPAVDAVIGELLAVNAIFRLRQAQGVLRLAERYSDERLEAACQRAIEAGDPSYRTVKGILAARTENAPVQQHLAGIDTPAWLRGPRAFGAGEATP